MSGVVIVGAGQGGFQLASSLKEGGFAGPVTLLGDEPGLPYQRPPLSKAFLKGADTQNSLVFRPEAYFAKHGITVRARTHVAEIDRRGQRVGIAGGDWVPYDQLVLATGARNRRLAAPGADLAGIISLRDVAEATALRGALADARRVVIVGGGFLGLEVAATAAGMGCAVRVVEAGDRLMGRAISPAISRHFLELHRAAGVVVGLGQTLSAFLGEGHVTGVRTTEDEEFPADLVVVAIGVQPNAELAEAAGLLVDRGIVVNHTLHTSDPRISALGDCALFPSPHAGGMVRLESVQNAVDQARCIAAGLLGKPAPYGAVPWFWSDQGARLQMAGLTADAEETVIVGGSDAFSAYCFRDGLLIGVESVNRPADHVKARRLLAAPEPLRIEAFRASIAAPAS